VLIGVPAQLMTVPESNDRFIPSLMFPCENDKAPNIGFKCFEDGSEFPSTKSIRELVAAGKLKGLGEITAQYAGIPPDDPRLDPYYALAEELDLPVGIHLGVAPPGVSYPGPGFPPNKSPNYRGDAGDPMKLESVLIRHPQLRLYVMHAGWPFRDHMVYMLDMHPQLYVDISALDWAIPQPAFYSYLKELIDAGFEKRIMFGSDGGVKQLRIGVSSIVNASFLTEEQKRDILYNNAFRFFRLDQAH
jgi:predicted TIM-barrel fold metal-dependent hydrolase